MTNPTPHGQMPEALRLADEISKAGAFPAYPRAPYEAAAAELRRLHAQVAALTEAPSYEHQRAIMEGERNASLDAYSRVVYLTQTESRIYEAAFTNGWNRLAALVEAQQPAAHVQNPAEIEHVVGDVSKNVAESNMSTQQPAPDEIISMAREQGLPETEIEGVFRVNVDDLGRMFAADRAARKQGGA